MTKVLTYVEIDVDFCSRSYGVGPCNAEIGVTGTAKCFNTLSTCQIRDHSSWAAVAPLPAHRHGHIGCVLLDGRVFVYGGVYGATVLAESYIYDQVANTWTNVLSMPAARFQAAGCTLANGTVFVCGGYDAGVHADSYIYNPTANTWATAASMPAARYGHIAKALPDGRVFVCGGYNAGVHVESYIYNPATDSWSTVASMPTARHTHAGCTLLDGRVFICGGYNGSVPRANSYIYSPTTDTWLVVAAMPAALYEHKACTLLDGKVFVCGGFDGSVAHSESYIYNLVTNSWITAASMPAVNYSFPMCTLIDGRVFIAGGYDGSAQYDEAYIYSLGYEKSSVTLRFGLDVGFLPDDIECIPSLTGVSFQPSQISVGGDLGTRASLSLTFKDHPHSDTGAGYDSYRSERAYDPFKQGTFWGKFRARQPFLRGRALRLIRGVLGQTLEQMTVRHFVIEETDGPSPQGRYSVTAKDTLKLADDDRSQAPKLSNGYLGSALTAIATSFTAQPVGVGNYEYPPSGYVAIGGNEICSFTRTDDVFTIVRGAKNTVAAAHEANDRVQLCLTYVARNPAFIIYDLFVTYAKVPAEYIDFGDWDIEVGAYLQRLYSATIADPVGVKTLVSELIEQAALYLWWDDSAQKIKLRVLRGMAAQHTFDESNILEGTLSSKELSDKRVTEVWTYYGQRNPLTKLDDPSNYRSALATIDLQTESDSGTSVIKKIMSRWIPDFGNSIAEHVNLLQLARYSTPPRQFSFMSHRFGDFLPELGSVYNFGNWTIQDETGARTQVPIQITRLNADESAYQIESEEFIMSDVADDTQDLTNRTITVDSDYLNFNLRTIHDTLYPEIVADESPPITVTCVINSGVIVGSATTSVPAFDVGSWPSGVSLELVVNGTIQGKGGDGGWGGPLSWPNPSAGSPGGRAVYTRHALAIDGSGAVKGGGGGGGGSALVTHSYLNQYIQRMAGGGGGQGKDGGTAGASDTNTAGTIDYQAANGSLTAPGTGAILNHEGRPGFTVGGNGGPSGGGGYTGSVGSPGFPYEEIVIAEGGAPGDAIDGVSYVTFVSGNTIARAGPEVN
jgi:N-acetylneuraminic acid mutarotase